jgi:hypothetical protein
MLDKFNEIIITVVLIIQSIIELNNKIIYLLYLCNITFIDKNAKKAYIEYEEPNEPEPPNVPEPEPKNQFIINDLTMISNYNFLKSKIIRCLIRNDKLNNISEGTKYMTILIDIYNTMTPDNIIKNTSFNIKIGKVQGNNYKYHEKLNMSIPKSKPANNTLSEICRIVKINNYKIDMDIELSDNKIIKISI